MQTISANHKQSSTLSILEVQTDIYQISLQAWHNSGELATNTVPSLRYGHALCQGYKHVYVFCQQLRPLGTNYVYCSWNDTFTWNGGNRDGKATSAPMCGGVPVFPQWKMASYRLQWKRWCLSLLPWLWHSTVEVDVQRHLRSWLRHACYRSVHNVLISWDSFSPQWEIASCVNIARSHAIQYLV